MPWYGNLVTHHTEEHHGWPEPSHGKDMETSPKTFQRYLSLPTLLDSRIVTLNSSQSGCVAFLRD